MKAKEVLELIARLDKVIEQKMERLEILREISISVNIQNANAGKGKGGHSDRVAKSVVDYATLEAEICELNITREVARWKLLDWINQIEDYKSSRVLADMFVFNKSLDAIADDTGYSASYVRKLKRHGIEHLQSLLDNFGNDFKNDFMNINIDI